MESIVDNNYSRIGGSLAGLLLLLVIVLAPSLVAARAQPELIGVKQGIVATAALQIRLPPSIRDEDIQWMALELDGIDVSQRVSLLVEGKQKIIQVAPSQPLTPGQHLLRLVRFSTNGSVTELGAWNFTVGAGQAVPAAANVQVQNELNISYRFNEDGGTDYGRKATINGTSQFQARIDKPGYQALGRVDLSYNSQLADVASVGSDPGADTGAIGADSGTNLLGGRHLDLGEYLVRVQNGNGTLGLAVGHQTLPKESLLVQNFSRRGVSINTVTTGKQASLTLYSMRTEPILGFEHGLGFSDPRHRVDGGVVTLNPIASAPGALAITTTYISGQGQDQNGVGQSAAMTAVSQGDGWSVAAESHLFKQRLKIRAERAGTRFDYDGSATILDKKSDTASAALLEYSPWPQGKMINDTALQWSSGVGYQETGLYFMSLANPSMPSDITTSSAYSRLQFGGFGIGLSLDRQQNNVTDNPELSTQRNDQTALSVSYSPRQPSGEVKKSFWRSFLGQPSLAFSYNRQRQRHLYLPAGGFEPRQDIVQHSWQTDANFMHDSWSWSVSQLGGLQNDNTDESPDQRSHQTNLGLNIQIGQRLVLAAQWQIGKIHQLQIDNTTRNRVSSLSAQFALVPDTLTAALQLGLNHDRSNSDLRDNSSRTASFKLNWNRIKARGSRPGMALWLQGDWQYNRSTNITSVRTANYRVLLGISIDWGIQSRVGQ